MSNYWVIYIGRVSLQAAGPFDTYQEAKEFADGLIPWRAPRILTDNITDADRNPRATRLRLKRGPRHSPTGN